MPLIESTKEVKPRSPSDVAKRLCAMAYTIRAGFGMPLEDVQKWLHKLHLYDVLGSEEKNILFSSELTEQQKINFTWQSECAQVFTWALNLADLDHFKACDDDLADKTPFETEISSFVAQARLRPITEIQRQADLLYRMHWAARECKRIGERCPVALEIISERRKAMDWIYGIAEDWNDIPLDT